VVVQPAVSADICILEWLPAVLASADRCLAIGITIVVPVIVYSTTTGTVIMIIRAYHIRVLPKAAAEHR
jgi:hypothetical protein